eukprot:CAMPEP_0115318838 /NCGR_PEP_ID=MMETSP0270-20121206/79424_1 /TAXON_ID=71861 /ORGANISM="Scrippsiella trochoidea, Strain CCMP3099" /LENGTH=391 /DNA_ID=CAMNT_0002738447 /DNA_START=1 /DNA_END=1173 /DNA_ORIENTATION=+
MTEFRRASSAVEALERLVTELAGALAAGGEPSAEAREKFVEASSKLKEVLPVADKMRRKCEARAELEAIKAQLREKLPGAPEEAVKVAQELVDAEGEGCDTLMPLLSKAHELESVATYGAKMVEKVLDLLQRFDVASSHLESEFAPKLVDAVAAASAADEARRTEEARVAAEAAAEAQRKAAEEDKKAVAGLLAENEQRLQEQRAKQEAEERQRLEEEEKRRQAEAALQAEEDALIRAEQEGEMRLAEIGPDPACGEALAAMLAAPVGPYRAAVEGLHGMLGGIAAEPEDVRLRVVRVANEGFQQQLGRRPGVWLFLRGVGFEVCSRESLPSGLLASLGLSSGNASDRFLYLREPNMMEAYEEWLTWHERIKGVAGFLHGLERLAFQRTAH